VNGGRDGCAYRAGTHSTERLLYQRVTGAQYQRHRAKQGQNRTPVRERSNVRCVQFTGTVGTGAGAVPRCPRHRHGTLGVECTGQRQKRLGCSKCDTVNPEDDTPYVDGSPSETSLGNDTRSSVQRNYDALNAAARPAGVR
jgi:hypothetical protein